MVLKSVWYNSFRKLIRLCDPSLRNTQYDYFEKLIEYFDMDYNWLDLGCGDQIVPEWLQVKEKLDQHFKTAQNRVTGIDIFKENLKKNSSVKQKLLGNLENLPIKNDSYHFITANMVMEHIKNPDILLKEVNRILIPGGSFIFHTPNILNYAP